MTNYQHIPIELGPSGTKGLDCRNASRVVIHLWGEGASKDEWNSGTVALKASGVDPRQAGSGFESAGDPEAALHASALAALWQAFAFPSGAVVLSSSSPAVTISEGDLPPFLRLDVSGLTEGHKLYGTATIYSRED